MQSGGLRSWPWPSRRCASPRCTRPETRGSPTAPRARTSYARSGRRKPSLPSRRKHWLAAEVRLVATIGAMQRIGTPRLGPILADPGVDSAWWLIPTDTADNLPGIHQSTVHPPGWPLLCPPTGWFQLQAPVAPPPGRLRRPEQPRPARRHTRAWRWAPTSRGDPRMTTTTDPLITLGFPLDEPMPPAECGVCQALVRQREQASGRGDLSRVTDCNVEIRNHHEPPQPASDSSFPPSCEPRRREGSAPRKPGASVRNRRIT